MARFVALMVGMALLLAVFAVQGTAPVGRALSALGLPGAALPLLSDPGDRGAALFRAGRYDEATDAFVAAKDPYNHGLAAAWAGDYAAALVAWEQVLARTPDDSQTRANHAVIEGLLASMEFQAVARPDDKPDDITLLAEPGQGKARAASTGEGANNRKTGFWMPEITSEGLRRVPKMFDAQFIAANDRWLDTLEDQPGRYLKARLAAEQKARVAAGTALPPAEDPE